MPIDSTRHALELRHSGRLLYADDRSWLHPLFGLRTFLRDSTIAIAEATLYDRIVGRAAALMIVALGIRTLEAGLLSARGEEILLRRSVSYHAHQRSTGLLCRTEQMLAAVHDPQEAWRMVTRLKNDLDE